MAPSAPATPNESSFTRGDDPQAPSSTQVQQPDDLAVLGLAFLGSGAGTVNLGLLPMANARFLADNGWRAAMVGQTRASAMR
jgi:hypothetical protein